MAQLVLNRNELAKFLPDPASIRQFEDLFATTNTTADQTAVNTGDITTLTTTVATKVDSTRLISTTAPLAGGGDLSANRTLSIPAASTTVNGYLASTDWNTFNGKQAALGFTPVNKAGDTGLGDIAMTKFGCNGAVAQGKVTLNAASTDLPTVVALCNQIRALLIANGQAI
jgi:hypothetical protein